MNLGDKARPRALRLMRQTNFGKTYLPRKFGK
jgi:hypothetical protein